MSSLPVMPRAVSVPGSGASRRVAGTRGPDDAWADALAGLVRSHRDRLVAPDPSRPWLAVPSRPDHVTTPSPFPAADRTAT